MASSKSKFKRLISTWGFSNYIVNFEKYGLCEETIAYLNDNQLDKIFGPKNYSDIIKFKLCAKKYKKEKVFQINFLF